MCKITFDTVYRANQRTMSQAKDIHRVLSTVASHDKLNVSVSVYGKVLRQNISTEKIKESFERALHYYGKEV